MSDKYSYILWLTLTLLASSWCQAQDIKDISIYQNRLQNQIQNGNDRGAATTLYQIALHYLGEHDNDNAAYYFKQAATKALNVQNMRLLGECYYHLGEVSHHYEGQEAMTESLVHLNKAIQVQRSISDTVGEVRSLMLMGQVYFKSGEFTKAALSLEEAEIKSLHLNLDHEKSELFQLLSAVYQKLDYQNKALLYHDLFMGIEFKGQDEIQTKKLQEIVSLDQVIIDSLEKDRKQKDLEIASLIQNAQKAKVKLYRLESELNKKEILIQKEKNKTLQTRIESERTVAIISSFLLIVSFILIVLLIKNLMHKKRTNQHLGEQKRQVEKDAMRLKKENSHYLANQDALKGVRRSLERELRELKILNEAHLQMIESTQTTSLEKVDQVINLVKNLHSLPTNISEKDTKYAIDNLLEVRKSIMGYEDIKSNFIN